jgi:hypothetical protein
MDLNSYKIVCVGKAFKVRASSKDEAIKILKEKVIGVEVTGIRKLPGSRPNLPLKVDTCAGRYEGERNDCTVRAISNVTGMEYDSVHRLLELYGRKNGKGFHLSHWLNYKEGKYLFNELFSKWNGTGHYTLSSFIKKNPTGTYLVCIDGHALCIKDGVILDTGYSRPMSRVHFVWEFSV